MIRSNRGPSRERSCGPWCCRVYNSDRTHPCRGLPVENVRRAVRRRLGRHRRNGTSATAQGVSPAALVRRQDHAGPGRGVRQHSTTAAPRRVRQHSRQRGGRAKHDHRFARPVPVRQRAARRLHLRRPARRCSTRSASPACRARPRWPPTGTRFASASRRSDAVAASNAPGSSSRRTAGSSSERCAMSRRCDRSPHARVEVTWMELWHQIGVT